MKNKKITKGMKFSELMEKFPEVMDVLFEKGMHCVGCPFAMEESIGEGAEAHGISPDKLVKEMNDVLKKK